MAVPSGTFIPVTLTVSAANATLQTATAALDTAVQSGLNTLYTTLPANFQEGTVTLGPITLVQSSTAYTLVQQIQYVVIAS
jgi:hypothetical protein